MDEHSVSRRRYVRYNTDLEVAIQQEGGTFGGRITQISRGGCLIYPALPAELAPHVKVSFRLSDQLPPINCYGEIVYNILDKGTGVALIALISGQIDMLVMAVPAAAAQVQAGKVRALAVLSAQRGRAVPNVPTAKEAGVANFEVPIWYGILAPAGTPRDIINRLNLELNKVVTTPDVRERLTTAGVEPITSTPEQFANFIKSETARYAKVIKDAGIKPE